MQPQEQPKESLLSRAVQAVLKDGTLAAAWRQGLDEIGQALKAFPESIQVSEMGTIGSPTPAEISQQRGVFSRDREQNNPSSLTDRARAAASNDPDSGQDHHQSHGREH